MCKLLKTTLLVIQAICITAVIAKAQDSGIFKESSYIKTYGINEFGRLVFIHDICEDGNGCIVLGTSEGISILRSDGSEFLSTPSKSAISHVRFQDGKILASGDVDHGFFEFGNSGSAIFRDIAGNSALKNARIIGVAQANGKTTLSGQNGIFVYDGQNITQNKLDKIAAASQCDSIPIVITKDSKFYALDGSTIHEKINLRDYGQQDPSEAKVIDIGNDSAAIIYAGRLIEFRKSLLSGKDRIEKSETKCIALECPDMSGCNVRDAQYDPILKKIAVSTSRGIFIFGRQGNLQKAISHDSGLPLEDAGRLMFDSKHNLWASLSTLLVKIEINTPTIYYNDRHGIKGDIFCLENFGGKYYCSTCNDLYISEYSEDRGTYFKKVAIRNSQSHITCMNIQVFDDHLMACAIDGLYEITGDEGFKVLSASKIFCIGKSKLLPGKMLIAANDGLMAADYHIADGKISVSGCSKVKGIDFPVCGIIADEDGTIWISSISNGLYHIAPKDSNLERFSLVNIGDNLNLQDIRQIRFNVAGNHLYIYGKKFLRANVPSNPNFLANDIVFEESDLFTKFTNQYREPESFSINGDGDVLIKTEENCVLAHRIPKTFDTINFKAKIKNINNVLQRDSLLFLSTNIGLLKHNLNAREYEKPGDYPFSIFITEISANDSCIFRGSRYFESGRPRDYTQQVDGYQSIGGEIRALKIKCSTSCFENSEQVSYSHILEGLEDKWSEFSAESSREFGELAPGCYTYRVKARNSNGIITEEAVFRFLVEKAFYQKWWFILLIAAIIGLPPARFISRILRENRRLTELEKEHQKEKIRQDERLRLLSLVASKNTNSVIILEGDGRLQWQNESFNNIYGYTAQEYRSKFGDNYFEIQKTFKPDIAQIIESAQSQKERASFENAHKGPDGNINYVQTHLDPVFDSSHEIKNWIITETDITQLKLAEKESMEQTLKFVEAYTDLKKNQDKMEIQTRVLKKMSERLEIGYKQIKRQNITINQSLRYAYAIQNSILPSGDKFDEFANHFVIHKPKDIVSGDFYMMAKLSDASFISIVADCTGHGVPGAFMSIIGYDILQQTIRFRKLTEPQDIVAQLSKQLIEMLSQKSIQNTDSIALSVCKFEKMEDKVRATISGSCSTVLIQDAASGQLRRIKTSRKSTGADSVPNDAKAFGEQVIEIEYGDRIFQFTDGIIDQCNTERKRFGTPRLMGILEKSIKTSMSATGDTLMNSLRSYMKDTKQRDDITILGFSIKK